MQMPNIWGEGAVFGCVKNADCSLHGRLCGNRIAVEFNKNSKCTLYVDLPDICDVDCSIVLSDCIVLCADDGLRKYNISMIAPCPNGILVRCDADVPLRVEFDGEYVQKDGVFTCRGDIYALEKRTYAGSVVYGFCYGDGCEIGAKNLCNSGFEQALEVAQNRYDKYPLPQHVAERYEPLYLRCLSIIEHNVSAGGCFGKISGGKFHMDTVNSLLCAVALKNVYPEYALATVLKVADYISDDGFLPVSITRGFGANAAPPVICYCFEQIAGSRRELVEKYYDKLRSCIMYFAENRDIDNNYMYQWLAGAKNDPGIESTMLNSPRFDGKVIVSGADLSAYMYMAAVSMGRLSRTINRNSDILYWGVLAQRIADAANNFLFDKEQGFYFDRYPIRNTLSRVKTTAGFMPLYAGFAPAEYVQSLAEHLDGKQLFGSVMGIPSVAREEQLYCLDMYRGSVIPAENYKIICGLVNAEQLEMAYIAATRYLETVRLAYESDGVLYEYYSSDRRVSHSRQKRLGAGITPMCRAAFELTRDCPVTAALVVGIINLLN